MRLFLPAVLTSRSQMKHLFCFATCLVVCTVSVVGSVNSDQMYILKLGRCKTSLEWKLEGLRPTWATNCSGADFDFDVISNDPDLLGTMFREWRFCPTDTSTPKDIWASEWRERGRCTDLAEHDYFAKAIQLYDHNVKYCQAHANSCFFCFNSAFKPIARLRCSGPAPPPPSPPAPRPAPRPGPKPPSGIRTYHLQLEKCKGSKTWTIHGLWPEWASNCPGPAFDMAALSSDIDVLKKKWTICPEYHNTYQEFWSHEWEVHGHCSPMSESEYFAKTLDLYDMHVAACPTEATAKSCYFCLDASDFKLLDRSQCHRPPHRNSSFGDESEVVAI